MLTNSRKLAHMSELAKIVKFCGDWTQVWLAGSMVPPKARPCWDQVAWIFMKFGGIIALIILGIIHIFSNFFAGQEVSHFGFCVSIFILRTRFRPLGCMKTHKTLHLQYV